MAHEHWKHFLALEVDLHTIARYVEPAPANFDTYSIELTKLFLGAASEAEVVCRVLCTSQNLAPRPANIDGWRTSLHSHFPKLHTVEIFAPKFSLKFSPWASWAAGVNPVWWQHHNDVKHERHNYFARASLTNALHAMAGLYVLLCYLHKGELLMRPDPFLERDGESEHLVTEGKPLP
jgi:hypothetical protein